MATTMKLTDKLNFKWGKKKVQRGISVSETRPNNFVAVITRNKEVVGRAYWSHGNPYPVFLTNGKKRMLTAEKNPAAIPFLTAVRNSCYALRAMRAEQEMKA